MIELPRACFIADRIARHADFFSFGTNDLTQCGIGFSRDDIEGRIIPRYVEEKIVDGSPFATIDQPGVGELVRIAVERGRRERPDLELGVCGEHGGDPESIRFFHDAGLDYVSCSPVPAADRPRSGRPGGNRGSACRRRRYHTADGSGRTRGRDGTGPCKRPVYVDLLPVRWMARKGFGRGDARSVPRRHQAAYERAGYVTAMRAANAGAYNPW